MNIRYWRLADIPTHKLVRYQPNGDYVQLGLVTRGTISRAKCKV